MMRKAGDEKPAEVQVDCVKMQLQLFAINYSPLAAGCQNGFDFWPADLTPARCWLILPAPEKPMRQIIRLIPPFLIAFVLDGVSKYLAELWLPSHQPLPVLGDFFRLTLGYNTGVAFGLFANGGNLPLVATGFVIAVLAVWLVRVMNQGDLPDSAVWPIGLLLGGAVGNFLDRLADGHVTDFLDVGLAAARWPTFNLADTFIVTSLCFLLVLSYRVSPSAAPPEAEDLSTPSDSRSGVSSG
ncbi:MAG: signal peptidase II [Chloroflexi bacterium]|nr:MAG: signal peptidase II [Chloroflexota bacterium]